LLVLWQDGLAGEEDAGAPITLAGPGLAGHRAAGFDLLCSFRQLLVAEARGDDLVLRNLRARDYPLLLRIKPVRQVLVPLSLGGSLGYPDRSGTIRKTCQLCAHHSRSRAASWQMHLG
jgi:hypothetical protein